LRVQVALTSFVPGWESFVCLCPARMWRTLSSCAAAFKRGPPPFFSTPPWLRRFALPSSLGTTMLSLLTWRPRVQELLLRAYPHTLDAAGGWLETTRRELLPRRVQYRGFSGIPALPPMHLSCRLGRERAPASSGLSRLVVVLMAV
jgi:hypothetical protein